MVDDLSAAPLPPLAAIPPELDSIAAYAARAPHHLPPATWTHIEEQAGSGAAGAANRAALERWRLIPRALADLSGGTTAAALPDGAHEAPILLAPLAYGRIAHPDGELAMARAATAIGIGMVLSTLSSVTLEAVAAAGAAAAAALGRPPAPLWFQLYLQPRRDDSLALVRRAEAAGYGAIVLTIDAAIKRSGFVLPPGVEAANLTGQAPPRHHAAPGGRLVFGTPLADMAPRWDDLARLREQTRLPVLVKGLFAGDDAHRMVAMGADGLILSNHGGRVADGLAAGLDLLPDVAAAVGPGVPVLIDGAIGSGIDTVKALCLGARAVLVGRPVLHALAVAGMAGVAHACHLLRAELEAAMAQLGCPTLADLKRDRLVGG